MPPASPPWAGVGKWAMDRTVRKTRSLVYNAAPALLLIPFFAAPHAWPQTAPPAPTATPAPQPAPAQPSTGIAFWDLPDHGMTIMLADPPRKEPDRYSRLRHYFTVLGCTGDHLSDLSLRKDAHHPILLCTLPGASAVRIVVTAWLPRVDLYNGAYDGWPAAVMLPMLYHALKAQPRSATFVFAALSGDHGDTDFQMQLESGGSAPPLAIVSITALGLGSPAFFNLPPSVLAPGVRSNAQTLQDEAWRMLRLQHIDTTLQAVASPFSPSATIHFGLVRNGPSDIPRILFYSNPVVPPGKDPAVTLPAFHQDYDFIAFYLCDLDTKLTPPSQ